MEQRKILHIDMDAFFAQVEQRNNPLLKGKPVIVGGDPNSRGVVSTCSYEARAYGVHSAMPTAHAYRLCPHGIFIRGNYSAYVEVSRQIREIFHRYSPLVEPLSLDEAYIDVTEPLRGPRSATLIAEEIRAEVFRTTELTCSAGVSYNKFLAKIASDMNKPNGITVITPEQAEEFISSLPVKKFFGVGKVTQEKMERLGILTGGDLRRFSKEELVHLFGKSGGSFYHYARGEDFREVVPNRERKSIGKELTFAKDLTSMEEMRAVIAALTEKVAAAAHQSQKSGETITVKIKYSDFRTVTRSQTIEKRTNLAEEILPAALQLLEKSEAAVRPVRLLGVTLSNITEKPKQHDLPIQLTIPGISPSVG